MRDNTDWHMHYPKPGDRFVELAATFIEVEAVGDKGVVVVEALPEKRLRVFNSTAEFRFAYRYKTLPGYMVRYTGNMREQ